MVGFFTFIFKKIDFNHVFELIKQSDWYYLFIALITIWFGFYIYAFRWQYVLCATQNIKLSIRSSFEQIIKGYILSQILPSSLGGDAYRILALKKYISLDRGFAVILIDRVIGLSMFFIFSICLSPFYRDVLLNSIIGIFLVVSLSAFLLGVISVLLLQKIIVRFMPKLDRYYGLFYNIFRKEYFYKIFISAIICGILFVLPVYFISLSLHISLSCMEYFLIMPLVFIATALPISFAGWGVREGAFIALLTIFGVEEEKALTLSIFYGVIMIIGTIPFLPLFFLKSSD